MALNQVKPAGRKVEARRLKGFRDFLPDAMATKLRVIDQIRAESRLFGFQTIATPALEYADTLLGIGEETDKQSYRFKDHGGRDVGLRFDLTVPFARFVAEHQGTLVFPFKKLQMGEVWRGENTQKGRYREFAQCDLDIIGTDHLLADAEILAVFYRILAKIGFGKFTMSVGSRPVLTGLIQKLLGISDVTLEAKCLIAVDKLAKIGPDSVVKLLVDQVGASELSARELLEALTAKDDQGHTDLALARQTFREDLALMGQLARLTETISLAQKGAGIDLQGSRESESQIKLDLSVARGLGYYTGVVFETTIEALPGFGSICSGGRYNDLVSRFVDRELPGVGGSIGLDRLITGLEELGLAVDGGSVNKAIFVAIATPSAIPYAMDLATDIRKFGLVCETGLTPKVATQLKHADRLGCRWVFVLGDEEEKSATLTLKDMVSGEQWRGLKRQSLKALLDEKLA